MNFLKNYFSTILFIFIIFAFYINNSYFYNFLNTNYSFSFSSFSLNSIDLFKYIIYSYIVLLIPFYFFEKWKSKARIVINFIWNKINYKNIVINSEEKTSILAWLLKAFYAPLMINWLAWHIFSLTNNIYNLYLNWNINLENSIYVFFNSNLFPSLFALILFIDVLFFTIWYLVESSFLKNKIISVEPTVFWWVVALICYPPFNSSLTNIVWWYSSDMWQFWNNFFHIIFNSLILILMWIYSRASLALWLKASNLTNRWIVKSWPYKYSRHPAYLCKNLAWWIWWLPIIFSSIYKTDLKTLFFAIFSLSIWSYMYYLRAKTEEIHLSNDKDYINYKKEVKNMFIPKFK